MSDILIAGVSTRRYEGVLPEAAGTVGVSKSAVSRRFIQASAAQLAALNESGLSALKLLAIYIDGIVVSGHDILVAVSVDEAGDKHLLGLECGASENAQVVKDLLHSMVKRGLDASLPYLFVIDGSKALRSAIDEVFGARAHVQRCRTHKLCNVLERLPKTEAAQTRAVMMAAYKLAPQEGMAKMRKQAQWLEREHPDAAASLLEGLTETFTVNALGLPPSLTRYQDADMALRWTVAGFIEAQKAFRKIQGVKDLWILKAALNRPPSKTTLTRLKRPLDVQRSAAQGCNYGWDIASKGQAMNDLNSSRSYPLGASVDRNSINPCSGTNAGQPNCSSMANRKLSAATGSPWVT